MNDRVRVDLCKCGETMKLRLRTVIFSGQVEITNVPVHTCRKCRKSVVCSESKPKLKAMIQRLGPNPNKMKMDFADYNEYARLLLMMVDHEYDDLSMQALVEERINELLDMMLVAKSAGDGEWVAELEQKLTQISKHRTRITACE